VEVWLSGEAPQALLLEWLRHLAAFLTRRASQPVKFEHATGSNPFILFK